MKNTLFVSLLLLLSACAKSTYSEDILASLTRNACPIARTKCLISARELDGNGTRTNIDGTYQLKRQDPDEYTYLLSGSARLKQDPETWQNFDYLEITFMFFDAGGLVREQKVTLKGAVGTFLDFSEEVVIQDEIVSSNWANYDWKPAE